MTHLTGTGRLFRLAVRRDRVLLPVWLVAISGLAVAVVSSVSALYTSAEERSQAAAFSAANVAARIFDGPASGSSLGAMTMVESYWLLAVLAAIMSAQAVVRHTRQDEETGRAELLGAAAIGRYARLAAALLLALVANLLLTGAVAGALIANDLPVAGSFAGGAAVAATGLTFAGVAAVTAQLSTTQRGANGLAMAVLGAAFLLRAVGDAAGEVAANQVELVSAWPSWLSPIGWGQQLRPFYQDNWEVLGLFGGLFAILVAVAFALTSRRDLGSGLLADRRGPATAPAALLSPLGLAWRLQRGILLAWLVGLVIVGAAFGAVGDSVDDFVGISDQFEQLIVAQAAGADLVDLFFGFLTGFLGIAAAGYTVQALLRMRAEEAAGHLESVLATAVSRATWLGSHALIAGAGTLLLLVATGVSGAVGYAFAAGDLATGLGMLQASLGQLPAVLAVGGFVVAVFGLVPRFAVALSWAALAVSLVMGQLGELLELPRPVLNVSPFTHLPPVPAESYAWLPAMIMVAVAAVLAVGGLVSFRRRDLALGA
ncbi:anibiotic ABC transporter [Natronosporangium hydrolyticum]|uniref:Anibiotic ABC transporter n=1 Tax=Natronosporangium hydrolyticum TaxID=2811111 RepID=A0A895YAL6_9ACTN|nr:anibiotic ABC transporter [Natronosporangium hydrolyticum]QSB13292.1 anibiotic ABC transporter [Natronosporangium hydrolyticum]